MLSAEGRFVLQQNILKVKERSESFASSVVTNRSVTIAFQKLRNPLLRLAAAHRRQEEAGAVVVPEAEVRVAAGEMY
jgi:hypothetical protein